MILQLPPQMFPPGHPPEFIQKVLDRPVETLYNVDMTTTTQETR